MSSKTIFCDIDGTLVKYNTDVIFQSKPTPLNPLPTTKDAIKSWINSDYQIILTTGRKESMRELTMKQLADAGIIYDQLIMGIGLGTRILINDKKDKQNTAFCVNLMQNSGLTYYDFNSTNVIIPDISQKDTVTPWGTEEILEYNDKYILKKVYIKAGESTYLQYHEVRKETIYVLSGKIKLYTGEKADKLKEQTLQHGDVVTISPFTIYKIEGIEHSCYLDTCSSEQSNAIVLENKNKKA